MVRLFAILLFSCPYLLGLLFFSVHTLYVSNISTRCSVSDIRRVFEDIGEVQDCRVVTNPVTR